MIKSWIRKIVRRSENPDPKAPVDTLAPKNTFYAVGDIHGRLDLLKQVLTRLDSDIPLVFVGDYIDRGDYSAQVLHHLRHLSESRDRKVVCLLGNHEEMMLRFLEEPKRASNLWLRNGGLQTLASFGLTGITEAALGDEAVEIAERLRAAMGEPLHTWLQNRPLVWTSGNISVVHAALDPTMPTDEQPRHICLWGNPQFPMSERADGQWVVHGHTIVPEPCIVGRVISIDTGAFATNRLSAVEISPGNARFISVGTDKQPGGDDLTDRGGNPSC